MVAVRAVKMMRGPDQWTSDEAEALAVELFDAYAWQDAVAAREPDLNPYEGLWVPAGFPGGDNRVAHRRWRVQMDAVTAEVERLRLELTRADEAVLKEVMKGGRDGNRQQECA